VDVQRDKQLATAAVDQTLTTPATVDVQWDVTFSMSKVWDEEKCPSF